MDSLLDEIIAAVAASAKYRDISSTLVRQLAAQELAKRRSHKEAIKATKNKLHQIAGAYLTDTPAYEAWCTELTAALAVAADQRALCRKWLTTHASTRERVPLLGEFYPRIFADLPPIHSILDLACGLNPLTIPWMNLPPATRYTASDIYSDPTERFQRILCLLGVVGTYSVCNLLERIPTEPVSVALLLKAIPCLEQIDKTIGARLISQIQADVLIVSFPARSLGGHQRGMATHYEAHFQELMRPFTYRYDKIEFSNELVFRIFKQ